jgi:hypothetical protein
MLGWCNSIRVFGRALRLPFVPAESRNAPIEAAIPRAVVATSHLMNCIVS